MSAIDLNCDLGESFGAYTIGLDKEVIPYITSANVACGFHAGDPLVMAKTVSMCKENHTHVGAHPGFPDLIGFGRRNLVVKPEEARAYLQYQIGALKAFCDAEDIRLNHVKPHGALYNMAGKDYTLARAIAEAVQSVDPTLVLLALSGSQMIRAAKEIGLPYASEVFADRAYQSDGSLVPRSQPGAMIVDEDEAVARVVRMAKEGKVTAIDGEEVELQADSVCVHGDGAKALEFVRKIRTAFAQAEVEVRAF